MLKKILVCLDGSKFAEGILPHAIERAKRFNSKIILLEVITVNISAYAIGVPQQSALVMSGVLQRDICIEETRARSYLNDVAKRLRETGLDVDWVALQGTTRGNIASTITSYATENEVDLIMIATHRHSFWKRLVYGSVAESLIRNSSTPVLVVNPTDTETEDGTSGWIPESAQPRIQSEGSLSPREIIDSPTG